MIDAAAAKGLFLKLRLSGLDPAGPLDWGYFFTAKGRAALQRASAELQAQGYRVIELKDDREKGLHWLHLAKVEQLSVGTLLARYEECERLVQRFGLLSFDGVDAGADAKRLEP